MSEAYLTPGCFYRHTLSAAPLGPRIGVPPICHEDWPTADGEGTGPSPTTAATNPLSAANAHALPAMLPGSPHPPLAWRSVGGPLPPARAGQRGGARSAASGTAGVD